MLRLLALAALLVLLGGCGRGDDRDTARAVTDRFFAAVDAGDGALACGQLNPETRSALEEQESSACRDAVTQLDLQGAPVESVEVYEREAFVRLTSGEAAFLDQGAEGWRISAAGCTPVGDKPYDCRLEN
jgi:hypothetical protein